MAMETPSKSTQSQSYDKSAGNGGAQRGTSSSSGSSSSASESFNIDPSSIERAKTSVHDAVDLLRIRPPRPLRNWARGRTR